MNEVSYYPQLAESLENIFSSNLTNSSINMKALYLPEHGSQVRSFLKKYIEMNPGNVSESLIKFSLDVPRLRTDIVILFDNPKTNKFKLVIVEVKLVTSAGLSELSQLIGYSLVTKIEYGVLVNINGSISSELKDILLTDIDISKIQRLDSKSSNKTEYKYSVLGYNSNTNNFNYIETLSRSSIPSLTEQLENEIS